MFDINANLTSQSKSLLVPDSATNMTRRQLMAGAVATVFVVSSPGCGGSKTTTEQPALLVTNPTPSLSGWETIDTSGTGPGLRSRHCLVYDRKADRVVLFGGIMWEAGEWYLFGDTWEFDGQIWKSIESTNMPTVRHRANMVYHDASRTTVLFGGFGSEGEALADTWLYSNQNWNPLESSNGTAPPGRGGHCIAYDEASGLAVMFGGINSDDESLGDTWVFDGSTWEPVDGPAPTARRYAAMAYHPGLGGCLLHGGAFDDHGQQKFGDAWLFKSRKWTRLPAKFDSSIRDDHGLIYHRKAKKLVMLEGVSAERGLLVHDGNSWKMAEVDPLHPRHQCSPLIWHDELDAVLMYGGEASHGGIQFDETRILHMPAAG